MSKTAVQERVKRLQAHLQQENPILADTVASFQDLDQIARKLGAMDDSESYATQVTWWPVISVLGTFSAGKSTFLNEYIGEDLQRTGNQAVDDKFTVICYGAEASNAVLPGIALDNDPRFPLFQISRDIERVAQGEGRRVDSYLQLKTCKSESLRGKIFVDSPGFDADQQRTSTLLITDQIIDLSDLVLVFFDARHPESGAMGDTLKHLVADTVSRPDATKFLYILNQIDNTFREDNPEEVVGAWQRALAQNGLTAGRFYRIYSRMAAVPIENEEIRTRLERKRDEDLADIQARIHQVEVERAYRVVGSLEKTARHLRDELVPQLIGAREAWRRRSLVTGATLFTAMVVAGFLVWNAAGGTWEATARWFASAGLYVGILLGGVSLGVVFYINLWVRRIAGRSVLKRLKREAADGKGPPGLASAFEKNLAAWWRSVASSRPQGWGRRAERKLEAVLRDADRFLQALNDRYANPSGSPDAEDGRE
jgi:GTPase SAR1 family protein